MHDERLTTSDIAADAAPRPEAPSPLGRTRRRRARRVVVGLTGLLGAAWVVVIASRYSMLMAG